MSKRDDGGRMGPMYRTAAEEALILAAIRERDTWNKWQMSSNDKNQDAMFDRHLMAGRLYAIAVRAVVRERRGKRG